MQKIRTKLEVYGSKCLPKKSRKTQINTLHLQLKELEKRTKSKVSRSKEIINIRKK